MKKKLRESLINQIENICKSYGLFFNKKKTVINDKPKNPIKFLGLKIFESSKYEFRNKQRQKYRLRIEPDKEKIIAKLMENRVLMRRGDISPYAVRDASKHQKNILLKKRSNRNRRTT